MVMEEKLIDAVKEYLKKEYNCHSIILYGSFASGDYTEESDIDLVCFCDNPKKENDTTVFNNRRLDAWIYKTEMMEEYTQFLHVKDGKIIFDERDLCTIFLNEINEQFIIGPKQLTLQEKDFLKSWLKKMLQRAKKGDIEGNFRYHWLLTDSLKIYFDIKGMWYLGPKKSLRWLYENNREAYYLFYNALRINADIAEIEKLIEYIVVS